MQVQVGNSPCSWGVDYAEDPKNPPWAKVMDEIAGAGYRVTELGPVGYYPEDAARLREEFGQRRLKVAAGFIFQPLHDPARRAQVMDVSRRTCRMLQALGARLLVVIDHIEPERGKTAGRPDVAPRLKPAEWAAMMTRVREVATMAQGEFGVTPVLHPHAACYIEYQDEIDRALAELDDKLVKLCVDTGHCAYAGVDPAALVRQAGTRTAYLHFKDIDPAVHARVVADGIDFDTAVSRKVFCPLGQGMVDFADFRAALTEIGNSNPFADAKASLAFLRHAGLAA
jgi:inosose dehydratase